MLSLPRVLPLFSLIFILLVWAGHTHAQTKGLTNAANDTQSDELPNVLILGDSISIGYTPVVIELLKGKANVFRPRNKKGGAENCAGTINGVQKIDTWLSAGDRKWSVIHFNFGLHDLKHVHPETKKNSNDPKHPRQSEPDAYRKQLAEIVAKLKATGAKLIFATTTPVPPGDVRPHRDVNDPKKYNDIAREIMKSNGIAINDLFTFANERQKELMLPANVHFKKPGSRALGEQVVKQILSALEKKANCP